jgi:hypothetical protein
MINAHALRALLFCVSLGACATAQAPSPQDAFFSNLRELCGRAYEGRIVSTDTADDQFRSERLVMHVRDCTNSEVRIPFNIGDNRSRTWVVTRTDQGVRLKHVHRHEDGEEDTLSQYGGDTAAIGTVERQDFPADAFSRALFVRSNLPASVDNVWAIEVRPGRMFVYELTRPHRHFRVEFDLSRPVAAPPPSWGAG